MGGEKAVDAPGGRGQFFLEEALVCKLPIVTNSTFNLKKVKSDFAALF